MAQPPALLQGPDPVETTDLHFKLLCKLKVFDTDTKYAEGHCCILAASQYYGLVFVGNKNGFSVIKAQSLNPSIDLEKYPRRDIILNLKPTHMCVDFSQKTLAVVYCSKADSILAFYDIQLFTQKDAKINPVIRVVQNAPIEVIDIAWQPVPDGSLTICWSNGSVLALSQGAKEGPMFTLPSTTQATCFCWSPKGKQIVIGSANGTLSQYKPDLKIVKTFPPPPLFNGNVMVVNVLWISSFQFAVAYNDVVNPESFPLITIVNAQKNEPVKVINYDDITYSSTLFRNHQIYMSHLSAWNLIFVSSANSFEVAVLHSKDGSAWEQWLLGDASRADLPLNPDRQETFPLGWAFDMTSQEPIPWGEKTLPPMPRLLLVSDEGLLCVFNIVNAEENAPQLCAAPKENVDDSLFVNASQTTTVETVEPPKPAQPAQPAKSLLGTPPTVESPKEVFSFKSNSGFEGFGAPKPNAPTAQTPQLSIQEQSGQQPQQSQPQQTFQMQQGQQQLFSFRQQPSTTSASKFSFAPQPTAPSAFSLKPGTTTLSNFATTTATTTVSQFFTPQATSLTSKPVTTQTSIFDGKPPITQSTPIKTKEEPPKKPSDTPAPTAVETKEKTTKDEPTQSGSPGPTTPNLATVDDSVYLSAIQEEIDHFNSELQQLSAKVKNLNINVGSEEDKVKMKKSLDGLYDFWKELKETTEGQSGEIHAVAMDLMEAFAWLEDAKSRNLQRKNPSYIELKKSEEWDPLNAKRMSEITHLKYYIENQLKQLTSYLEKEWMDHQESYRNEVKNKMTVPPLEEVYKTMHYQLKILAKQKALVEELKEQMAKKRKNKFQGILTSVNSGTQNNDNRSSELSKLAENLLQLKINKEQKHPQSGAWNILNSQIKTISERSKKLTKEKQNALRDVLSECGTVKIRPVKANIEFSSFLRSLILEKPKAKVAETTKVEETKVKEKTPQPVKTVIQTPIARVEEKAKPVPEKTVEKAVAAPKIDPPKVFNVDKPIVPLSVESLAKSDAKVAEKSPLASLSGIVMSLEKPEETKAPKPFVFGSSSFQKTEPSKETFSFGSLKVEQKPEEPKPTQPFSFGKSEPTESIFGKKEPSIFGGKSLFGTSTSITPVSTKPELTKTTPAPNVTITPVTVTTAATTPAPFTFTASSTASNTTGFPKMNLSFSGTKEQSSGFGGLSTSVNLFSAASNVSKTTAPSLFGTGTPIFGGAGTKTTTNTFTMSGTSLFGSLKTTPETTAQPTGFTFTPPVESKPEASTNATVPTSIKPTSETEEVDVLKVDEPVKKPEPAPEKPKDSPKTKTTTFTFGIAPPVLETTSAVTSSAAPPNVTVVSTQSADTNLFGKLSTAVETPAKTSTESSTTTTASVVSTATTTTTTATPTTSTTSVVVTAVTTTPATTAPSVFSFSTAALGFGQTGTTTTSTTTASLFGTPTTQTSSIFGQVSSTTPPTTNIFGGSAASTPTTNIFGNSTPTKPIFGQAATTPTSENIFGSKPNAFGQISSSTPTTFGQKSDPVSQTSNLFGQLLSDSNRSVFGGSPTTATTTASNLFNVPKNFFGGGSSSSSSNTNTASLFGTSTSSIFPQTTIFGQPTTSPSVFGQSQTSTTSSFFGQNICSPFGSGTPTTSNQTTFESDTFNKPVLGQSIFGGSSSIFGGSPSGSIFGGTSSTTASSVFQTPTTSTTFGTPTPGPFSGGASTFGETSFGSSSSTFRKPLGGFGSPPVFGGGPAFGSSTTFGGSPTFGSMATFGNVSQGTFGQTAGSSTFENLANQNTVGFGNLAQQPQSQGFGGGFGSPTFENKPAFGGDSFSSWRSK